MRLKQAMTEGLKMNKIIIPSSKLISKEMRSVFGDIPPILLPVNSNETQIELISRKNPNAKIYILTNEGDHLIDELIKTKRLKNVKTIYCKNNNSLAELISSLNEEDFKKTTLIFGDTLIQDGEISEFDGNSFFVNDSLEDISSKEWTFTNDKFQIFDKPDSFISDDCKYFFTGIFQFENFGNFISDIRDINDFYKTIQKQLISGIAILKKDDSWKDYGNKKNFYKNKIIQPRFFNEIFVDEKKGTITKKSVEVSKFKNEIKWFLDLPASLKKYTPKIHNYSLEDDLFVEMDLVKAPTISELLVHSNINNESWEKIISKLIEVKKEMNICGEIEISKNDIENSLIEIYFKKTMDRMNLLKEDDRFYHYFNANELWINQKQYKSIKWILENIEQVIKEKLLNIDEFNIIHGDYFFANQLYDSNSKQLFLIDPRGDFGGYGIYGDYRYDLAKLLHSVRGGYDFIVHDMFDIEVEFNEELEIKYDIYKKENVKNIISILESKIESEFNLDINDEILLIESILFISMVPLHKDNFSRQQVMLVRGIELFNEYLRRKND